MPAPLDKRLVQRATATRNFLVAVALTGIGTSLLVIVQAWLIAKAVGGSFDRAQEGLPGMLPGIAKYAGLLILVFAARGVLSWLDSWLGHRASAKVKSQLRRDIMAARLSRPADSSTPSGTLITLLTKELDALDGYFAKYLPQLAKAATIPIIVVAVILLADWQSAVICAVTVPLIPIMMALIGWKTQDQVNRRFKVQSRLANHFADLVSGLQTLQVFGRAKAQIKGLKVSEDASRKETMKTLRLAFLSSGVLELLATLSVALVAVTIGFRVVYGHVDLTNSLFVLVLAPEVFLPVRMVGQLFHDSANGTAAANAALNYIERAESGLGSGTEAPGSLTSAEIVFDEVTMRYPNADEDSLTNFSMTLRPGEVTALVGRSGGGKTTTLSLLLGFEQPTSGQITVDDAPLSQLNLGAWREQIAYVAQEPGMINGTIADNIRLGDPEATEEQMRSALDRSGGELLDLSRHVGDDAEGLSAGERRRVAMARALLRIELGGANLLVLDEPTAGLDQKTEARVVDSLRSSGVGALIVTHRDAILNLADQVIEVGLKQGTEAK
ncbi:thiol reductant ABC exporter subunit CydD [Propionimicrobium lymphophilum]|uniref:thiol reductant ABC exporter subunit CydD n=1 Tax=Propionimicrobium lymphophilum TaxID=33012 RepID=UPI00254A05CF|nr:thiol reductant ABC exporter subunit CydD [Propionimicrobium lymphophilum]MDK7710463.1 thiol reductant ABC exporter subunit CydD [Propionimicrobium lymphophilum]MDK7734515.1 thiol reductant ABC exporter subunit CydD [Propionimicrobium lymphophilum]